MFVTNIAVQSQGSDFFQRTKSTPEVLIFREGKVIIQNYPLTMKFFMVIWLRSRIWTVTIKNIEMTI